MRVDRLREVMAAVRGSPPSAEDLAETLWFACQLAGARGQERLPGPSPPLAVPPRGVPAPRVTRPRKTPPPVPVRLDGDEHGEARVPLLSAPSPPPPGDAAVDVLVRESRALEHWLDFHRALRPLNRRVPSRRLDLVDEEATAALIAEQRDRPRSWAPVLRGSRERWLDAVVVLDGTESMAIWRRLARDTWDMLVQAGIFRDVTLWRMNRNADGDVIVSASGSRAARHPAELIDPAGRRAIFVLSDCVGPAWRSGACGRVLHRWSGHGPVVVLQPLPERLWGRTGAPTVPGTLSGPAGGVPNALLRFVPFDGMGSPAGHTPVPVLEVSPAWVRRWARLVGAGATVPTAVTFVAADQPALPRLTAGAPVSAVDRVRHFRSAASPEAFRLAGYVAMTTPTLPIMRHVHHAMTPRPEPAHLAEVVLSGLLRPVNAASGEYAFVDEVEELLLDTVSRADALRVEDVLIRTAERIEAQGSGAGEMFRALLGVRGGDHAVPPGSRRFALLNHHALRRLRTVPGASSADAAPAPPAPAVPREATRPGGGPRIAARPGPVGANPVSLATSADGVPVARGWHLGGGLVLTAVPDAAEWWISGLGPRSRPGYLRRRFDESGLALLEVPGVAPVEDPPGLARWGALETVDHRVLCEVRLTPAGVPGQVWGHADGRYRLAAALAEPVGGAPVFCGGLLVGVALDGDPVVVAPAVQLLRDPAGVDLLGRHGVSAGTGDVEFGRLFTATVPARVETLLNPYASVVRFTGHAAELRALRDWCVGDGTSIRLLTGRGGEGKTRLARQLVADLRQAGWVAGCLTVDADELAEFEALARVRGPLLVVVDEADVRPTQAQAVIRLAAGSGGPVRILFLARSAGDWWDSLRQGTTGGVDRLAPLAPDIGTRRTAFATAVEDLDTALESMFGPGSWAPGEAPSEGDPDLTAPHLSRVLDLHVEALRAALRLRALEVAEQVRDAVERAALWREREYGERAAIEARLSYASADMLDDAVAAVHLFGAESPSQARQLVARLLGPGDDADRIRRIARWLHEMYPGDEGRYCGSLAPEVVGLHLAEEAAERRPEPFLALLPMATAEQVGYLRAVIDRGRLRFPRVVSVLSAGPLGPQPAVSYPVPEPEPEPRPARPAPPPAATTPTPTAPAVEPVEPTDSAAPLPDVAVELRIQAEALLAVGHHTGALTAIRESLRLYQALYAADTETYTMDLAATLRVSALVWCELGDFDRGLRNFTAAADLYRRAREHDPAAEFRMASVLLEQGERLQRWRPTVAVRALADAARISRDQLRNDPVDPYDAIRSLLARCYELIAAIMRAQGKMFQAQHYAAEARLVRSQMGHPDAPSL